MALHSGVGIADLGWRDDKLQLAEQAMCFLCGQMGHGKAAVQLDGFRCSDRKAQRFANTAIGAGED